MCKQGGIETYVAKLNEGYVVKRMPDTGNQHAATCPHFEPAVHASGQRSMLGTAIREDPVSGLTTVRVDFAMSTSTSTHRQPSKLCATTRPASARNDLRLSLRGLLLYLWQEAGLTRWHPGFTGKRPWSTVRRRLLESAGDKVIGGHPLVDRLYVPEPFNVNDREGISRRRFSSWAAATMGTAASGHLLLLIGELEEIAPARCGFKAVVKQVPDLAFTIDNRLYHLISKRLQPTLGLWSSTNDVRMLVAATFGLSPSGIPYIVELAVSATTWDWIPIENTFDRHLVQRLIAEGRSFLQFPRLDSPQIDNIPSATLLDCSNSTPELFVVLNANSSHNADAATRCETGKSWVWRVAEGPIPPFPC